MALLILGIVVPLISPAIKRLPQLARHTPRELFDSANYYLEKRNAPDSALLCLTAMTAMAEADPDFDTSSEIYPIAYQTMGAIHASVYGNYSDAALNMLKGLELARQQNLTNWENRIAFNLSAMEYEQGRLIGVDSIVESSISKFSDILSKLSISEDKGLAATILTNMAEMGIRENIPVKVKEIFARYNVADSLGFPVKNLVDITSLLAERKYGEAEKQIDTTISGLSESTSYLMSSLNSSCHIIRAHILLLAGKEKEALEAYNDAIVMCEGLQDLFSVFEIYSHLHRYYEKKGNPLLEKEFELKELRAKDRLVNRSRSLSVEQSQAIFNEEKLKRDIVLEVSRSHTYLIVFWVSIIFLIIVLSLLWILYRKFRQLQKSRKIIVRNDLEYFTLAASGSDSMGKRSEDIGDGSLSESQRIYERISEVIKNNNEIYEEDFNTGRLAELVGDKPGKVSAAILEATGETTTQYIARNRIREACRRINDKENYGGYTIEAIGQSVGYRSRSHFGSVFKKIVGMTPSEYIANLRGEIRN